MSNRPLLQSRAQCLRRCCPPAAPRSRLHTIAAAATVAGERRSKANIDWDTLGFGLKDVAGSMYVSEWTQDKGWDQGKLVPYGPITIMPSAQVLNYGQAIFEGMKAQESSKGRVVVFRPDQNAARFKAGAARMSMPSVPEEQFVEAVKATVAANLDYVPPIGKGSLYLRPLLLGTGPILGLGPAPSYTFTIFAAAVGAYFKGGQLTPIDLLVEERFHRAAPGGMGGTKAAGNYSPVLVTQLEAKKNGFADVVYLDAKTDTYLEEVSSCNIFVVKGRTIKTPPLQGTILPGVTRRSIVELARSRGYDVHEEPVTVHEAMEADEVFTTGTAVVVSSVGSMTYRGQRKQYTEPGQAGKVALEMYANLTDIQTERAEDKFGWVVPIN
ncbi:branched chain amino acid aminotransferase [Volvox carteri f. nagariensis]|uniref:Branched-chain-amino-acid aminotransferase n=1 Tax=Volvox carteri f. nagariensis TaxID=3068 RepID=D8U218_VOLCA|nr:branched chain amino acid aminotransferase [Volvox carteri f. nagariensis]EFJ46286.1 branched chain amino acid aminotransferase [Volvox carteri f. nagariensis]|eukprot:XP_002952733.1 branched chain amino acid aminotransferase [Volvox carteri f. nagariensis]